MNCEGSCEEHYGEVLLVNVSNGWGTFWYCQEAIAEDIRRGFVVEPVQDSEEVIHE